MYPPFPFLPFLFFQKKEWRKLGIASGLRYCLSSVKEIWWQDFCVTKSRLDIFISWIEFLIQIKVFILSLPNNVNNVYFKILFSLYFNIEWEKYFQSKTFPSYHIESSTKMNWIMRNSNGCQIVILCRQEVLIAL